MGTLGVLAGTVATLFLVALTADEPTGGLAGQPAEPPAPEPELLGSTELLDLVERLTPAVAHRVEAIRGLEFERIPEARTISVARLQRQIERRLRKPRVERRTDAAEAGLRLLGLLGAEEDFGDVATESIGLVLGYYDPRKNALFLVSDGIETGPELAEATLAHELTHALEDQHYGLRRPDAVTGDRALAQSALLEGTAETVGAIYGRRHLDPAAILAESTAAAVDPSDVAEIVRAQSVFVYGDGARFVARLRAISDGWGLVDHAWTRRPPASTEQILHLDKYLAGEPPIRVPAPTSPGPDWERVESGPFGEFGTREILRASDPLFGGEVAAAGWGGDNSQLFVKRGQSDACVQSCRSTHALGWHWRGDDEPAARLFADALADYAENGLGGEARGGASWKLAGGWAALSREGELVGLGLAPDLQTARTLANLRG
jgi:hypothetical protein